MAFEQRCNLIKQIEASRNSFVITYLTSLRPNANGTIADDAVRKFFDHLLALPERRVPQIDLYLCSNGGSSTVPWRLVPLLREFADKLCVLVPYRCYSAATLIALGADEIVMHPFAELGPIDPTVSNDFNPIEEGTGRRLGISVEDVKAYINFIKSTVGITHEDELIKALEALLQQVHPLALGNVERFISQSRMIAKKILSTHNEKVQEHEIAEIIESMASKLYFHGHPINRKEAVDDLRLKVVQPDADLERNLWELYKSYEEEFQNGVVFNPLAQINALTQPTVPQPSRPMLEVDIAFNAVESVRGGADWLRQRKRYLLHQPGPGQQLLQEDLLMQAWIHSEAITVGRAGEPTPVVIS